MKAYPSISFDSLGQITTLKEGMDLRDYFAAQAMQGLIIAEIESCKHFNQDRPWKWFDIDMNENDLTDLARRTFDLADAMMKAREQ
jgi:hypothetical protein